MKHWMKPVQKLPQKQTRDNPPILCKLQNVVQTGKFMQGGSGVSCCRLVYKIAAPRGHVKGGGVSLRSSRPLTCRRAAGQSGMRLEKNTDSWAWIRLQSCRLPVHFFVISIMAKYSIFSRMSSVGNTDFDFVTFRSCRLKHSMALVV